METSRTRFAGLLGPAFVAAVAYVDPGNVAANLSAGARYGHQLLWVLAAANLMAMVVQYQSAKLGVVTGRSLSSHVAAWCSQRPHGHGWRRLYAAQALAMAVATDIAEVIGGALGLTLLFGIPLWLGGVLVGATTLLALELVRQRGERAFEVLVGGVLALVAAGFLAALWWAPPSPTDALAGLRPTFPDRDSVPLAAAMLGATVMPHAIYLHSTLAADRHRAPDASGQPRAADIPRLLHAQRVDVALALLVAGSVNIAMLLFAARVLPGSAADESIEAAHAIVARLLGAPAATLLALGLLTSGLGSALVGTHAGARIMRDLVPAPPSPARRRALVLVPAVALLCLGHPTTMLVGSQLVLSFGIAFALVPLVLLSGSPRTMGRHADPPPLRVVSGLVVVAVVALNAYLLAEPLLALAG